MSKKNRGHDGSFLPPGLCYVKAHRTNEYVVTIYDPITHNPKRKSFSCQYGLYSLDEAKEAALKYLKENRIVKERVIGESKGTKGCGYLGETLPPGVSYSNVQKRYTVSFNLNKLKHSKHFGLATLSKKIQNETDIVDEEYLMEMAARQALQEAIAFRDRIAPPTPNISTRKRKRSEMVRYGHANQVLPERLTYVCTTVKRAHYIVQVTGEDVYERFSEHYYGCIDEAYKRACEFLMDVNAMYPKRKKQQFLKSDYKSRRSEYSSWKDLQKDAINRNYEFAINREHFQTLRVQDCYVCDKESTTHAPSGVDRFNNNLGYTIQNCKPCCSFCNHAKACREFNVFLGMARRILLKHRYTGIDPPSSFTTEELKNLIFPTSKQLDFLIKRRAPEPKDVSTNKGQRRAFSDFFGNSKNRKIENLLKMEEHSEIISQDCYLCGAKAKDVLMTVDRLDSTKVYVKDNCLPCCVYCNQFKGIEDFDDLLQQCEKILLAQKFTFKL
jgi:hypothetical protein